MPTVQDLSAGEIIPQMGFAPTQNQNGGWSATRDYYMLQSTWEDTAIQLRFARGSSALSADPSIPSLYNFLTVESKTANYEDSGTVRVSVLYTGSSSNPFDAESGVLSVDSLPTYRLEGRLREMPLLEHPLFEELNPIEKTGLSQVARGDAAVGPENKVGTWVSDGAAIATTFYPSQLDGEEIAIESEYALNFLNLLAKGVTTYVSPSFVWIETTQGNSGMSSSQLTSLGQVDVPRGSPPNISGQNRDWMLTNATQEQRGDLFQTTLEWSLSETDGWDQFLYGAP